MIRYSKYMKRIELDFEKIVVFNYNLALLSEAGYYLNKVKYDHISFYDEEFENEIVFYPEMSFDLDQGVSEQGKAAAIEFIQQLKKDVEQMMPRYIEEITQAYEYLKERGEIK